MNDIYFPPRELEVMSILWRLGSATVADVRDALDEPLAYTSVLSALQTLEVISKSGGAFSDALKPFRRYWNSGEINSEVADKEGAMRRVEQAYSDGRVDHTDGLLVDYDDWWFSLRPSNTEPLLRLNVEARDPAVGEAERDKILSMIRS